MLNLESEDLGSILNGGNIGIIANAACMWKTLMLRNTKWDFLKFFSTTSVSVVQLKEEFLRSFIP